MALMIALELLYIIGPVVKYSAVKHLKKFLFLLHICGQSTLLIIFLSLVLGMTFKGYKYGNGTTTDDYDPGKWQYGQNVCILVVSIAVIAELLIFFASIFLMIRGIVLMLIESMTSPKTSSDVSKEKLSQHFVSYKNGVFFTFFDSDAPVVKKTESKQDGKKPEKNKNRVSKGPQEPKKLTVES